MQPTVSIASAKLKITRSVVSPLNNKSKLDDCYYFEKLLPYCHNDSVIIFDDIRWSRGMEDIWEEVKNDKRVTVTIDLFQVGMAYLRKEQKKENFKVRF